MQYTATYKENTTSTYLNGKLVKTEISPVKIKYITVDEVHMPIHGNRVPRKHKKFVNERTRKRRKVYFANNPEALQKFREKRKILNRTTKFRYRRYITSAKNRKLEFDISFNEFENIVKQSCHYCGKEGYGIDRVDSGKGYIKNNSVPCCSVCNIMKNDSTKDDFIKQCKLISEKF